MMYDYFRVTGAHDTVLDYADLFSITQRNDDVQEFHARSDEILSSITKIPPDDILESLYKLRIRESDQPKTVLELNDSEIHQKMPRPDYQKLKTMLRSSIDHKLHLRNVDARNERIETGAVVASRRRLVVLKEEKEFAISGKQKDSVREETNAVSSTTVMSVRNQHQKPLHPLGLQLKELEVRQEKGISEAGVQLCGDFLNGIALDLPCDNW